MASPQKVPHARLSGEWQQDYTAKIRSGSIEDTIQSRTPFAELSAVHVNAKVTADECILIIPSEQPATGSSKDDDAAATRVFRLPLLRPSLGHRCIDIRPLLAQAGVATYDPGFVSTASCHSAITFIDGPAGTLLHRGYRIEELCAHSDFEELSFLLLYGQLPAARDKAYHAAQLRAHALVHEKMCAFYQGFRYNAHPMAIMCAVVGALSSFYHSELDIGNAEHRWLCAYRLVAKMPTLAAMAYKTSIGQPIVYPRSSRSYAENLLAMMFSVPAEEYRVSRVQARALDRFLMLHADHEQNASTSTVRIAGSSHANPFACIASGITALWGPAHGGANEAVLAMLRAIGSKANIAAFVARAKDKQDPFRLMGFGHRVYKNYDPRAKVMRDICYELLQERGANTADDPLFELAMELERVALSDEYFVSRKLFPNVDFYSGLVLKALGVPVSMFTVLFAVGRTIGWVAHWKEMIQDPKQRIGRPRQLYVGPKQRDYKPIKEREEQLTECLDAAAANEDEAQIDKLKLM